MISQNLSTPKINGTVSVLLTKSPFKKGNVRFTTVLFKILPVCNVMFHYSFSRSKYFHLLIAPILKDSYLIIG